MTNPDYTEIIQESLDWAEKNLPSSYLEVMNFDRFKDVDVFIDANPLEQICLIGLYCYANGLNALDNFPAPEGMSKQAQTVISDISECKRAGTEPVTRAGKIILAGGNLKEIFEDA